MKKIPNIYARDAKGKLLVGTWHDDTLWVKDGEGVPTRKRDGTACMVRGGVLFKRYDRKLDKKTKQYKDTPAGWEACQDPDPVTGHWPGWMPVGDGPEDRWHRDAWMFKNADRAGVGPVPDGTYELCGPKIQGNPEDLGDEHLLIRHGEALGFLEPGETLDERIRASLAIWRIEGIVFHHPDGRMAKIHRADLGFPWPVKS